MTNPLNDIDDGWAWLDGLPLGWRYKYFPTNALTVNPDADADEDGMSNLDEAIAGTNPTNDTSFLTLSCIHAVSLNNLRLYWLSLPDRTYRIYSTDILTPTNSFHSIYSAVQGHTNGLMEYIPEEGKFFRLSVEY